MFSGAFQVNVGLQLYFDFDIENDLSSRPLGCSAVESVQDTVLCQSSSKAILMVLHEKFGNKWMYIPISTSPSGRNPQNHNFYDFGHFLWILLPLFTGNRAAQP